MDGYNELLDTWRPSERDCPPPLCRPRMSFEEPDPVLDQRQRLDAIAEGRSCHFTERKQSMGNRKTRPMRASQNVKSSNTTPRHEKRQPPAAGSFTIEMGVTDQSSPATQPFDAPSYFDSLLSTDHECRRLQDQESKLKSSLTQLKEYLVMVSRGPHQTFTNSLKEKVSAAEQSLLTMQGSLNASRSKRVKLLLAANKCFDQKTTEGRTTTSSTEAKLLELERQIDEEKQARENERADFQSQLKSLEVTLTTLADNLTAQPAEPPLSNTPVLQTVASIQQKVNDTECRLEVLSAAFSKNEDSITQCNDQLHGLGTHNRNNAALYNVVREMATKLDTTLKDNRAIDERVVRNEAILATGLDDVHKTITRLPSQINYQQLSIQGQRAMQNFSELNARVQRLEVTLQNLLATVNQLDITVSRRFAVAAESNRVCLTKCDDLVAAFCEAKQSFDGKVTSLKQDLKQVNNAVAVLKTTKDTSLDNTGEERTQRCYDAKGVDIDKPRITAAERVQYARDSSSPPERAEQSARADCSKNKHKRKLDANVSRSPEESTKPIERRKRRTPRHQHKQGQDSFTLSD